MRKYYYLYNDFIYNDLEDIKEEYIDNYVVLDDAMTDFVTQEEEDAVEITEEEALKYISEGVASFAKDRK